MLFQKLIQFKKLEKTNPNQNNTLIMNQTLKSQNKQP